MGGLNKKVKAKNLFFLDESNENEIIFNRRFSVPIALAGAIYSFLSILANQVIHLKEAVSIISYISFAAYLISYILLYYNKWINFVKYFIIGYTLLIINAIWYFNNGANGPVLYIFILLYSYLIFMLNGKQLVFFTVLIAINVSFLFYIEYNYPGIVSTYKGPKQQVEDVYFSTIFYGIIAFIMMYIAKTSYIKAYYEAKEADKLKTAFLENMSHEIRTPLNAIVGFSSMLAEQDLDQSETIEYAKYIKESNQSILQLINDILDVSVIESGQLVLNNEDININKLLFNIYNKYNRVIQNSDKDIELILNLPSDEFHILGDSLRLNQVLENLIDNAVKFTDKGTITIGVEEKKYDLYFYVKDTGIGFPEALKDKIFNQFYKLDDSKEKIFRGTGMGLFLCKQLVIAMGGNINARSEEKKGSNFYFTIPKNGFRKVKNHKADVLINKQNNEEHVSINKNIKILVVEDDQTSRTYYKKLLNKMNMEAVQVENGKKAVELFLTNPDINFDAILMDIKMPGLDGFDTLREIRKINPEIPVIAQTAYAMNFFRKKCIEAGFDAFLEKPVTKNSLLKALKETGALN